MNLDIPTCPECGYLAEDLGDGEIYCEHCYNLFINWMHRVMGGAEGLAKFAETLRQDQKLGIGLDRRADGELGT